MNTHQHHAVNVKPDAVSTAIHPTTYRGGGFLAHGVLKVPDAIRDSISQSMQK